MSSKNESPDLVEIIVPSNIRIGQVVVFMGKKYKVIEVLNIVKINQLISYALGEYVSEY